MKSQAGRVFFHLSFHLKNVVAIAMMLVTSFVAGCGQSSGGSNGAVQANAPVQQSLNGYGTVCPDSQYFNPSFGCMSQGGCQPGMVMNGNQCVPVSFLNPGAASAYQTLSGSLIVNNPQEFAKLLKYKGLCDPYWFGWNWGDWNCKSWTSRSGFLQIYGTTGQVTVRIGSGNAFKSVFFDERANVSDFNNSSGVQIVGVSNVGVRLIVDSGHLTDSAINGRLVFQGADIATFAVSKQ